MTRRLSPREIARAIQRLRDDDADDINVESTVVTVTEEDLEVVEMTVDGITKAFERPDWPDQPDDPALRTDHPAITVNYTDDPTGGRATENTDTEP